MNMHLSKAKRCVKSGVSQELMDLIADRLRGKEYGYVKIIIQDSHVFAIEENERRHLVDGFGERNFERSKARK